MSTNPADTTSQDDVFALRSAASLAAERPLEPGEALGILRDCAQALARTHAAGGVHGVVCGENIVLDAAGRAALCHDTLQSPHPSPEQQRGAPPDVGSDVYGLGAAIAGLLGQRRQLPEPIQRLLAHMAAEEPAERYQSMDEVLTALEACELLTGHRAYRPGQRAAAVRARRVVVFALVALVGLALVGLALLMSLGETPPGTGREPEVHRELIEHLGPAPARATRPAKR